jgi:CLIP-associating protein 1/2
LQVLESTNALISLLAETSDPLFLLSILRRGLASYLLLHPVGEVAEADADAPVPVQVLLGEAARASGYLFGLNGMGMCILRLPSEVVVVESKYLEEVVMDVSGCPFLSDHCFPTNRLDHDLSPSSSR